MNGPPSTPASLNLHASTVAVTPKAGGQPRGLVIIGPSGSGKTELAVSLIALGARLVADDRTLLTREGTALIATCPEAIRGLIEVRGLGLLEVPPLDRVAVTAVVDMSTTETERLPPPRMWTALGVDVPCLHSVERSDFPSALMLYMAHGYRSVG